MADHRTTQSVTRIQRTCEGMKAAVSRSRLTSGRCAASASQDDGDFIVSLMQPVSEPGQFANWIAPPRVGIDNKPGDFEYVKIAA